MQRLTVVTNKKEDTNRFLKEIEKIKEISNLHSNLNILRIENEFKENDSFYIVMEYIQVGALSIQ